VLAHPAHAVCSYESSIAGAMERAGDADPPSPNALEKGRNGACQARAASALTCRAKAGNPCSTVVY
jgi:hypothetical protein